MLVKNPRELHNLTFLYPILNYNGDNPIEHNTVVTVNPYKNDGQIAMQKYKLIITI